MSQSVNARKVAIVGCGFVGSAAAFTLMQSKLFSEMVLLDANTERQRARQWILPMAFPLQAR